MESIQNAERKFFDILSQTLGGGTKGSFVHKLCRTITPYWIEFFGALIITLTVALTNRSDDGFDATNQMAPIAIGAMVTAMLYSYGHVSGAHFNPSVTMAVFIRGKISLLTLIPYFAFQVAGAVAGATIAVRVVGGVQYLPAFELDHDAVSTGDAFLLEFLYTYALCTTVLNTATTASLHGNQFYGIAIGFVLIAGITSIGPVTGAALNPAFATAFHVIHSKFSQSDLWVYWISGLMAGICAGLTFHITNNEEIDLRFLSPEIKVETTLEHRAAAVGGQTNTYHEVCTVHLHDLCLFCRR